MDDALAVCRIERVGNFDGNGKELFQVEGLPGDAVFQSHPIEEFHHHKRAAVFLADIVHGADVGMVQGGCNPGLSLESSQGLRVAGHFSG